MQIYLLSYGIIIVFEPFDGFLEFDVKVFEGEVWEGVEEELVAARFLDDAFFFLDNIEWRVELICDFLNDVDNFEFFMREDDMVKLKGIKGVDHFIHNFDDIPGIDKLPHAVLAGWDAMGSVFLFSEIELVDECRGNVSII